ncbi:hypothetical protein [Verrucomicrobium sp. BvORR034]|uniref:hypothetical protein n=1 Tax=Verrucomicrobium sp. BvORR034 TaxID=1396418 RepID=UPI0006797030|nr:hypothetical protein [Verrucomicrobium sp. BvORR034]
MPPWIAPVVAFLSLIVSGLTAWFTFFRRGSLRMTQPTLIFMGPDGPRFDGRKNKIYLRTLLYSTAKRGMVIESLHIALHRNDTKQNFNIWVYGERSELKRGSGLYVPQEGVALDHHFLQPEDGASFGFLAGAYRLTLFAKLVGDGAATELITIPLTITETRAAELAQPQTGLYFDWSPDQQSYHAHADSRPESAQLLQQLLGVIAEGGTKQPS